MRWQYPQKRELNIEVGAASLLDFIERLSNSASFKQTSRLYQLVLEIVMTIISSLKCTNTHRPRQQPAIVQHRNKLTIALHDQLELARAEAEGREYLKTRRRHVKNPMTGEYAEAVVSRRPRTWFWTADDGKLYICLRYGTRVLELAKGKSAIEVGEKNSWCQ